VQKKSVLAKKTFQTARKQGSTMLSRRKTATSRSTVGRERNLEVSLFIVHLLGIMVPSDAQALRDPAKEPNRGLRVLPQITSANGF
jgi:hypothetical protein